MTSIQPGRVPWNTGNLWLTAASPKPQAVLAARCSRSRGSLMAYGLGLETAGEGSGAGGGGGRKGAIFGGFGGGFPIFAGFFVGFFRAPPQKGGVSGSFF